MKKPKTFLSQLTELELYNCCNACFNYLNELKNKDKSGIRNDELENLLARIAKVKIQSDKEFLESKVVPPKE